MLMSLLEAVGELSELRPAVAVLFHFIPFSPDRTKHAELHSSANTKPGASSGGPQHPPVPKNLTPHPYLSSRKLL